MKEIHKKSQAPTLLSLFEGQFKAIHFIFNDLKKQNIENLKKLVPKECQEFGFQVNHGTNDDNLLKYQLFDDSESAVKWMFQVTFVVGRFEDLAVPTNADNIFSFIDPCGIAQIPLSTVEKFIGKSKEAFINLMLLTILRNSSKTNTPPCIYKLFGQSGAVSRVVATAKDEQRELKEKYKMFVTEYEKELEKISETNDARAIHFLFANGKSDSEKGNQFYMVFFSSTISRLKAIQDMKYTMQRFTQENGDNRFTDYYSWNGIEVPLGRKTTNEDEALQIWTKLQGQTMTLFEVQQWVLFESPFAYHARALRKLEKQGCLLVDSSQGVKRSKKSFKASSSQFGKHATKLWKLTFGSDAPKF